MLLRPSADSAKRSPSSVEVAAEDERAQQQVEAALVEPEGGGHAGGGLCGSCASASNSPSRTPAMMQRAFSMPKSVSSTGMGTRPAASAMRSAIDVGIAPYCMPVAYWIRVSGIW